MYHQQTEDLVFDDSDEEDESFNLFSNSVKNQTVSSSERTENESIGSESGSDSNSDSDDEETLSKKLKLSRTTVDSKASDSSKIVDASVTLSSSGKNVDTTDTLKGLKSDNSNSETEDSDDDMEEEEEEDDENEDEDSEEEEDSGEDISDEEEEDEEGNLKWKANLAAAAAESFKKRQTERINYRKLIYGKGKHNQQGPQI